MRNQFAVVHNPSGFSGIFQRVMFEGDDTGDVYAWLKKNSALDAPSYYVIDRLTSVRWEEGEFIREFDEQVAKASSAGLGKKREAVLKIIRDINRADRVGETNFDGEYLDSEEIAQQIVSIFTPGSE